MSFQHDVMLQAHFPVVGKVLCNYKQLYRLFFINVTEVIEINSINVIDKSGLSKLFYLLQFLSYFKHTKF